VAAGIVLPFLDVGGTSPTLADAGWSATAAAVVAGLLVVGGTGAFFGRWGVGLAGGAALCFLGLALLTLTEVAEAVQLFDDIGVDGGVGSATAAWLVAGALALAVSIGALASLGAPRGAAWPYVISSLGLLLLAIGVLVPPAGLDVGEHLFGGETGSDAGVVMMLAALVGAAIAQVAARSPASGFLALGVAGPWLASWLAFAVHDESGGLPIPFADQPALVAICIILISFSWVGACWWGAPAALGATAAATPAGVGAAGAGAFAFGAVPATGGVGFGAAQVLTVVVCGASVLVGAGGAASAATSDGYGAYDVAYGSTYGSDGFETDVGELSYEEDDSYVDDSYDTSAGSGSATSSGGSGSVDVEECVEVECNPVGSSSGEGSWDDGYSLGEPCSPAIAADIRADLPGRDPGELVSRYEAGNFVIHICEGAQGETYHGENVTNGNRIVLEASGSPSQGFTAYNDNYEYFIDQASLQIYENGGLLQEDVVVAYEEP